MTGPGISIASRTDTRRGAGAVDRWPPKVNLSKHQSFDLERLRWFMPAFCKTAGHDFYAKTAVGRLKRPDDHSLEQKEKANCLIGDI